MSRADQQPYLSVIIPAYNEENRIGKTLDSVYDYLTRQTFDWEILVVLDGPTDDTIGVVRQFAESKDEDKEYIRWIDRRQNRGKGYTVREGMLEAHGQIRLFTDADNSTDISHFDKMKPLFDEGYAVVICTRDSKDIPSAHQAVPQPFFRRMLGDMGNLFIQAVAVPGIWDTQCGFKAFAQESAERIFATARVDRWAFDIEALAIAQHFRYQIGLVPAYWVDADGTHVRSIDYITTLLETVRIRWNLITGSYGKRSSMAHEADVVR